MMTKSSSSKLLIRRRQQRPQFWISLLIAIIIFPNQEVFVSGQQLYISQICPTSKHSVLSLVPADDDEYSDKNPPVYQFYDKDDETVADDVEGDEVLLFRECSCPRPTGRPTPIACPLDSRFCAIPTDASIPVRCYAEEASVMVVRNVSFLFCVVVVGIVVSTTTPSPHLQPFRRKVSPSIPPSLSPYFHCKSNNQKHSCFYVCFVSQIWPLMLLWYLCFILFVCCSYKGRQAILFCCSKCIPTLNGALVDRMLQRQRQQFTLANIWRQAARARMWNNNTRTNNNDNGDNENGDNGENETNDNGDNVEETDQEQPLEQSQQSNIQSMFQRPPTALELKTKKFDFSMIHNGDDENNEAYDEDDHCCTICFVPLEEGDRIGDLSCNHLFHVDCLKSWVQRKNTCPLCAAPMATPSNKSSRHNNNNHHHHHPNQQQPSPQRRSLFPFLQQLSQQRQQQQQREQQSMEEEQQEDDPTPETINTNPTLSSLGMSSPPSSPSSQAQLRSTGRSGSSSFAVAISDSLSSPPSSSGRRRRGGGGGDENV